MYVVFLHPQILHLHKQTANFKWYYTNIYGMLFSPHKPLANADLLPL